MARERDKEWGSYCARTSIRREKIKEAGNESRDVNQLKKIKKSTNTDFLKGDRKRTTESGGGINSTIMVLNLPNSPLTLCLPFCRFLLFLLHSIREGWVVEKGQVALVHYSLV